MWLFIEIMTHHKFGDSIMIKIATDLFTIMFYIYIYLYIGHMYICPTPSFMYDLASDVKQFYRVMVSTYNT